MTARKRTNVDFKELADKLLGYLSTGGTAKKAVALLIVLGGALFTYLNVDERLDASESRSTAISATVDTLEVRVDSTERRVAELEASVEVVQVGVNKAVENLRKAARLIKDLQKIRDELIDAVNGRGP